MTTISLFTNDQHLSVAMQPKIASGDWNSVRLHVDFDAKWDAYAKSAVFFTSNDETVYEMILTAGECTIPHEVLAESGILYIGVRGVKASNQAVKTSSIVKYKVVDGAPAGNGTTVEPTADVYQQILSAYGSVDDRFAQVSDEIAQAMADAEQQHPLFANSVAELEKSGDTSKLYVLPDGMIYAYMHTTDALYTNQIANSVDENGNPYNNGKGWKSGYRLNSSGTETASSVDSVTGFIPVKYGDVVRFKNFPYIPNAEGTGYIAIYTANLGMITSAQSKHFGDNAYFFRPYTVDEETGHITSVTLASEYENPGYAYIRISAPGLDGTAVITVNEEIVESEGYAWKSTGHAFVPADYEDRIVAAEKDIDRLEKVVAGDMAVYGIVDSENNIIMTGSLVSGKYTLKYIAEDGTTIDICEFTM